MSDTDEKRVSVPASLLERLQWESQQLAELRSALGEATGIRYEADSGECWAGPDDEMIGEVERLRQATRHLPELGLVREQLEALELELCGRGEVDPGDVDDPRWTPALRIARDVRRTLHRFQHGVEVEGDYVCDSACNMQLEIDRLRERLSLWESRPQTMWSDEEHEPGYWVRVPEEE